MSQAAVYVYGLTDLAALVVRYVGMTGNPLNRLRQHSTSARHGMVVLDVCSSRREAADSERRWIAEGGARGWPLLNRAPQHGPRVYRTRALSADGVQFLAALGAAIDAGASYEEIAVAGCCRSGTVRRWLNEEKVPQNPLVREAVEKYLQKRSVPK